MNVVRYLLGGGADWGRAARLKVAGFPVRFSPRFVAIGVDTFGSRKLGDVRHLVTDSATGRFS
jgi:hypothetical protein